ncbi:hypothetical protein [Sphingobacterium deserti]|uniref:Uncharacterized protein n=1 Tax=Sphingobacterium deserti TaxID=1229276 RepID=A0A0B8T509_9SPHI|nr:hypothetical protein [Sphingobacterium deserti]KGE12459.1 hypothetical protein DI53_3724 [Sphingobacterium deserti]
MKFFLRLCLTSILSTIFTFAALANKQGYPFLLMALSVWVIFIWVTVKGYDRRRRERLQGDAYQRYQNMQMQDYWIWKQQQDRKMKK